jgi:hypothetical protein
MARIRSTKPEYWSHPVMSLQDDAVQKLGVALLNFADDEGYFLASPAQVRSNCFPVDEDSTKARRCLAQLAKIGYIETREHPSHGAIGLVVNFTKHQAIDRPKPSKLKTYFDAVASSTNRRALDDESLLEQGTGNGTGKGISTCATDVAPGLVEVSSQQSEKSKAQTEKSPRLLPGEETVLTDGPLHSHVRALIRNVWLRHNPNVPTCPWDGKEGKLLDTLLKKTPQWTLEHYRRCLENLFASDHFTVSTPPGEFILLLPKYLNGPLNEFKNPKGSERVDAREAVRRREANVGVWHPPAEEAEERIPVADITKAIANVVGGKVMR